MSSYQLVYINQEVYDLFPHRGVNARHGSASIDISTLFVYVSADTYLSKTGRLGFVITQSVFKSSGGSEGFRQFHIAKKEPLGVYRVDDFSDIQVFEGAKNRTAILFLKKNQKTNYPVPYFYWKNSKRSIKTLDIPDGPSLQPISLNAWPVQEGNNCSPWITLSNTFASAVQKVLGKSEYVAKLGVHTWLNGVYWVRKVKPIDKDHFLITNDYEGGKKKVKQTTALVEAELLYPLLRGVDTQRWRANPSLYIIIPHDKARPGRGIPLQIMKQKYPQAFSYFMLHKESLENRSGFKKFIKPSKGPYYAVYNIGDYTFMPYKVVWKEQAKFIESTVVSNDNQGCLIIPDHKLTILGLSDKYEAYMIAALLNSTPAQITVASYAIQIQISTHVLNYLNIPLFDQNNLLQKTIADLGIKCSLAAQKGDTKNLSKLEIEIDKKAAKLWGITDNELKTIQEALEEMGKSKSQIKRNIHDPRGEHP